MSESDRISVIVKMRMSQSKRISGREKARTRNLEIVCV